MQRTAIINEILFEDGYMSSDDALNDWSVMIALSRIDQFRAEKESFENKYRKSFESYENDLRTVKGKEDFEKENDLEDWEFACKALIWWEDKLRALGNA
ncbi:MAG: hypothetical protein WCJ37_00085 [Syntrophus sp. (in: bacteria)]